MRAGGDDGALASQCWWMLGERSVRVGDDRGEGRCFRCWWRCLRLGGGEASEVGGSATPYSHRLEGGGEGTIEVALRERIVSFPLFLR